MAWVKVDDQYWNMSLIQRIMLLTVYPNRDHKAYEITYWDNQGHRGCMATFQDEIPARAAFDDLVQQLDT